MKKKQKLLVALCATLTLQPFVGAVDLVGLSFSQVQAQAQKLLSLGASLTPEQQELTKKLLGAGGVTPLLINGELVDKYLHDGSNINTTVYSSAYIEKQAPGYGVQVQIVTPQNITLVSPTTYQNAAITSGAKDVLIRIATVSPVTGEGALAGVYALLEQSGVKIDPQAIKVAEKEIQLVQVIKQEVNITEIQINQCIALIKKEIITQVGQNNGIINNQQAEVIVNNVINNVTNNNVTINISDSTKKELTQFAEDFAKTETAKDQDTVKQLEQSVDNTLNGSWKDVLKGITEAKTADELLKTKDETLAKVTNPAIKAMFDSFYKVLENNPQNMFIIYKHTFVVEKMLGDVSPTDHQQLNLLRMYCVQALMNYEKEQSNVMPDAPEAAPARLLAVLEASEKQNNDPTYKVLIDQIGMLTGNPSEAFYYANAKQEGDEVQFEIILKQIDTLRPIMQVACNLKTGEIRSLTQDVPIDVFDFKKVYHAELENQYKAPVEIATDYRLPASESVAPDLSSDESDTSTNSENGASEATASNAPAESATSESATSDSTTTESATSSTASDATSTSAADNASSAASEAPATEQTSTTSIDNTAPTLQFATDTLSGKIATAYQQVLQQSAQYFTQSTADTAIEYAIFYLNGDQIPELLVRRSHGGIDSGLYDYKLFSYNPTQQALIEYVEPLMSGVASAGGYRGSLESSKAFKGVYSTTMNSGSGNYTVDLISLPKQQFVRETLVQGKVGDSSDSTASDHEEIIFSPINDASYLQQMAERSVEATQAEASSSSSVASVATNQSTENNETKPVTTPTTQFDTSQLSGQVAAAYQAIVTNPATYFKDATDKTTYEYTIFYMNKDEIPELLVKGNNSSVDPTVHDMKLFSYDPAKQALFMYTQPLATWTRTFVKASRSNQGIYEFSRVGAGSLLTLYSITLDNNQFTQTMLLNGARGVSDEAMPNAADQEEFQFVPTSDLSYVQQVAQREIHISAPATTPAPAPATTPAPASAVSSETVAPASSEAIAAQPVAEVKSETTVAPAQSNESDKQAKLAEAKAKGAQIFEGTIRLLTEDELAALQGYTNDYPSPFKGKYVILVWDAPKAVEGVVADGTSVRTMVKPDSKLILLYSNEKDFSEKAKIYDGKRVQVIVDNRDKKHIVFPTDSSFPRGEARVKIGFADILQ